MSAPDSANQLVLGSTTLADARRLFPDAPAYPGPIAGDSNPHPVPPDSKLEVGTASVKFQYVFWLGPGRAALYFDRNQRLVSISQGAHAYRDPNSGKFVAEEEPWAGEGITRNAFRAHYLGSTGQWFDRYHYRIEGRLSDCVAMTAWFTQKQWNDRLLILSYHYTCPTQPLALK